MDHEDRRERVYVMLGRLEALKHSMFWLLRPAGKNAEAVRAKAKALREIADEVDTLADEMGG